MVFNDLRAPGSISARMQKGTRITSGFSTLAALGPPGELLLLQNIVFFLWILNDFR